MTTNNMINTPAPFALNKGGTGAILTANIGGIFYSTASAGAILAGTATANQALLSGSSSAPAWSTATYPSTTTVSQLLYSSSTNVIGGLSTANSAALVTSSSGVPTWSSTMTNGQLIIGSTAATPTAATLTAGTGVTITNGAGSITIAASGGALSWSTITAATLAAAINNGYILNHAATPCVVTLPATAALGSTMRFYGLAGSGGWTVTANTAQTIQFGNTSSSSAGSWSSTDPGDSCLVTCIVANTTWALSDAVSSGLTVA